MIKEYRSGNDFIEENREYLMTDKYQSAFFFLDGPYLTESNETNFCFKVVDNEHKLLLLKVEPFPALVMGDKECVEEMIRYLFVKKYECNRILCEQDLGNKIAQEYSKKGLEYIEDLAMDFMETAEITEPSDEEVCIPNDSDFEELLEMKDRFLKDCGLLEPLDKEKLKKDILDYRILRNDGKIVSMARIAQKTLESAKITDVYTRDECRGKGYARRVVNTLKNEIIESGRIATLNVDQKNPISNHVYKSIGFVKVFSQGEYRLHD